MAAKASHKEAEAWCGQYRLAKMASYSVLKYGAHTAGMLAKAWVHKMQFLYTSFHAESHQPQPDYTEPEELARGS